MVHLPYLLAGAAGAHLEKRDTTTWATVLSTSLLDWDAPTSVTVGGYVTTERAASGTVPVVSTVTYTTFTTYGLATLPLLSPAPLDPGCTSDVSAYFRDLENINTDLPTFEVGYDPTCLPTGWYSVTYYSPGVCPTGYTIDGDAISISTAGRAETEVTCCYTSYKYDIDLYGCTSHFNPVLFPTASGTEITGTVTTAPAVGAVTAWTVVADFTEVSFSTSTYLKAVVSGSLVTSESWKSWTPVQTSSGHTIASGNGAAIILAPSIAIRWVSDDREVVSWYSAQLSSNSSTPASAKPTPPAPPPKLSAGAIAGIAIGAVAVIALVIGALLLCLRKRKQRQQVDPVTAYEEDTAQEPKAYDERQHGPVYVETVLPKSELDSQPLSPEQYAARSPPHEYQPFEVPATESAPASGRYKAYHPPASEVEGTEIQPSSPSITGSAAYSPDRARSPSEWTDSTAHPDTDFSGFVLKDANSTVPRSSVSQLEKLKEERARLERLQQISEQEARLEEQLERELADDRERK